MKTEPCPYSHAHADIDSLFLGQSIQVRPIPESTFCSFSFKMYFWQILRELFSTLTCCRDCIFYSYLIHIFLTLKLYTLFVFVRINYSHVVRPLCCSISESTVWAWEELSRERGNMWCYTKASKKISALAMESEGCCYVCLCEHAEFFYFHMWILVSAQLTLSWQVVYIDDIVEALLVSAFVPCCILN